MPLIDVRSIFLQAKENQERKRAEAAKKKKDEASNKGAEGKKAVQDQPIKPSYEKCTRSGCKNGRQYSGIGLCQSCYEQLVKQADETGERYGQRAPILDEHRFKKGEACLISEQHPNAGFRGLYATVVEVEDSGAVLLVELSGDSSDYHVSSRIKRMRGQTLHVLAQWLLKVDPIDDDDEVQVK